MTTQELMEIVGEITFRDWLLFVGVEEQRPYLQAIFIEGGLEQRGRKWMLSPFMTKSEVVQTAFLAIMTAIEHEVREQFRYQGKLIFGPHFDVDKLAQLAGKKENLDMRPGSWVAA